MPDDTRSPHDWRDQIEGSFGRGVRESRHDKRTVCNVAVPYWIEGEPEERTGVVRNLSELGAFLETDPLRPGTRLRIGGELSKGAEPLPAMVVWREDPGPSARLRALRGVGVRFLRDGR